MYRVGKREIIPRHFWREHSTLRLACNQKGMCGRARSNPKLSIAQLHTFVYLITLCFANKNETIQTRFGKYSQVLYMLYSMLYYTQLSANRNYSTTCYTFPNSSQCSLSTEWPVSQ